ncbi:MAG: hypothetical protein MUF65_10035 [Rubritepida sp.]|nr:hypothetical protein [Rubritepida sp.]
MRDWLLILPVLIPLLATGAAAALIGRPQLQRRVTLAAAGLSLLAALALLVAVLRGGVLASQMGDWAAPFGITLVADHLAAAMVLITALMYAVTAVYALGDAAIAADEDHWHPLLAALVMGVSGAFLRATSSTSTSGSRCC